MAKAFGEQLGRTLRTAAGKSESRTKLMGAVRAACRRLGIEDDDRRALQLEVTGEASLATMTLGQMGKLLDRLNKDWKGPSGDRAHLGKVRALWWTLYWLGAVDHPTDTALSGFVRRQAKVDRLEFLDHRKAASVIEALKDWAVREGVRWPSAAKVDEAAAWPHPVGPALLDRYAVLDAIERALVSRRIIYGSWCQYLAVPLKTPISKHHWTARELDEGIRILGKQLRRALEKERAAD